MHIVHLLFTIIHFFLGLALGIVGLALGFILDVAVLGAIFAAVGYGGYKLVGISTSKRKELGP